jgi:hypothetical protein
MASITIWSRLEPHAWRGRKDAGGDAKQPDPVERGLEARFRDPAWALARQLALGELTGDDAGSPVKARVNARHVPLTSYRPAPTGPALDLDAKVPLEAQVEREPVDLRLRGSVQLGLRFEAMLRAAPGSLGKHAPSFRTVYPLESSVAAEGLEDRDAAPLRSLAVGRVTDGGALADAVAQSEADLATIAPVAALDPPEDRQRVAQVLADFLAYRRALYSEPDQHSPWVSRDLRYRFSVGSEGDEEDIALDATDYGGGRLEWHSFSLGSDPLGPGSTAQATTINRTFVPNAVSFRGMPNDRWWNFEDGQTDFGRLDVEQVDLGKLILMEFALVHGDDWFELPLPLPTGTLSRVDHLTVTNTFGEETEVRPTEERAPARRRPWSLFRLGASEERSRLLFLPPALGIVDEGTELEEVLFTRDEMAAMAWAIERRLPGPLDRAIDGYERYLMRLADEHPPQGPRERSAGGPGIEYVLGGTVPDNWIPLIPVKTSGRGLLFRRGLMQAPVRTGSGEDEFALRDVRARGRLLEPWHRFHVADEAVPRTGARVTRSFRRARSPDGSTFVWLARRASLGRGEGSSGLRWDVLEPLAEPQERS